MDKPIGGRGKKAPYETTHVRIPVDLKAQVEQLVQEYRNNGNSVSDKDNSISVTTDLIKHQELIDFMINQFKENGLYLAQDDRLKPRHTIPVRKEEAFRIAGNLVKKCRTKKELAKILLAQVFAIDSDEVDLDILT
jgi:hypothetical protein